MDENALGESVLGSALRVHKALGPGLLESAYEACVAHEIEKIGHAVKRQVILPVIYDDMRVDAGYRLDLLVGDRIVVGVKSVERLTDVHRAQLLSLLEARRVQAWLPPNFNVTRLKDGISRMVNGL